LLQKKTGRLNGWLSYTFSRSLRQIPGVNNDKFYPAFYDRPHDFSIYLAYQLNRWELSANWILASGMAFSSPTGFYQYQNYAVPLYGEKNNDRLPMYHRLDLAASFQLNKKEKRFLHSLSLGLFNAYARKNPISINFNKTLDREGIIKVPANFYPAPELITSSLSLVGIIPSITYKFKFR